ncbi:MBL fold metallo-hydrolase [Acaryochloris marina NIES-2412]|uniref:MBL fold metallo-hydrolase n=1 Tax=Acaryochloris marina TaxID=155978 RepID=UPI004059A354
MLFRQLYDQESSTYTYLLADSKSHRALLVDTVLEQVERDFKLLQELNLTLSFCVETHIHADHITGTNQLQSKTGCLSVVPAQAHSACADRHLKDGEVLTLGNISLKAIATPGHTDGHHAYLVNRDRVLTGDALFIRGCGRTDFQSGDAGTLYDSVTQKLFTLPGATFVYPGHDYHGLTVSTIEEERQWNPRFKGSDRNAFIEFMNALDLPNPRKIMEAVPANEHCGRVVSALER